MPETIHCQIFGYPELERVESYFTARGIELGEDIDGKTFYVELIHKPTILTELEIATGVSAGSSETWQLMWASSAGLLFYIAYAPGDGTVFIPESNIIAVHTIKPHFVDECRKRAPDQTGAGRP